MPDCGAAVMGASLGRSGRSATCSEPCGPGCLPRPRVPGVAAAAVATGLLLAACTGTFSPGDFLSGAPIAAPQASSADRRRQYQGRPDPAAVGRRQCRGDGAVHAQRRRDCAGRIQRAGYPVAGERRRRQRRRRPAGRAAAARRGGRDHPRAAVRAFGRASRTTGTQPRHPGDRVLDRLQCRRPRCLSPELPAGIRRRAADWLRRAAGQARLCRGDPGQSLRHRGGGRLQAVCRAAPGAHHRLRALFCRPRADAGDRSQPGAGGKPRRRACSSPTPPTPCRRSCRR